jgi:hypothetical protein
MISDSEMRSMSEARDSEVESICRNGLRMKEPQFGS